MGTFYHGVTQEDFEREFGGLSAEHAAALILGEADLTKGQLECLHRARGNSAYRMLFEPEPISGIKFVPAGTEGCGNRGWLMLLPESDEVRRIVNKKRREKFRKWLPEPLQANADRLFSAARGYQPVLDAIIGMAPLFIATPKITNKTLRDAGFRPGHPNEGEAVRLLRDLMQHDANVYDDSPKAVERLRSQRPAP